MCAWARGDFDGGPRLSEGKKMAGRSRTRGPWGGWVLLLLLFFLPASAAPASDVFFPDISAASPNGRFRLDAKSPDNVPGASQFGPPRFQKDFQYVLRAVAFAKFFIATRGENMRERYEFGLFKTQGFIESEIVGSARNVFNAAHDMSDAHGVIIDNMGEIIGGETVFFDENNIVLNFWTGM